MANYTKQDARYSVRLVTGASFGAGTFEVWDSRQGRALIGFFISEDDAKKLADRLNAAYAASLAGARC
jgi:hypothetical protein